MIEVDQEKRANATVRGPKAAACAIGDERATRRGDARGVASTRTGEKNLDQADDSAHALITLLGGHHLRRVTLDALRHRVVMRVRVVAGPARLIVVFLFASTCRDNRPYETMGMIKSTF